MDEHRFLEADHVGRSGKLCAAKTGPRSVPTKTFRVITVTWRPWPAAAAGHSARAMKTARAARESVARS